MFLLSQFSSWYEIYLVKYPLTTKATTTVIIGLVGDTVAQVHEERLRVKQVHKSLRISPSNTTGVKFHYDARRGLASAINNLFLTAPIYHYGYEWFDRLLPIDGDYSSSSSMGISMTALGQVLIDCAIFDATFVVLMLLSSDAIEGYQNRDVSQTAAHRLRLTLSHLLQAIIASWRINFFVIPIQYVLFRYFPLRVRVLGLNAIDLIWDTVMSFVIHHRRSLNANGTGDGGWSDNESEDSQSEDLSQSSNSSTPSLTPWSSPLSTGLSSDESDSLHQRKQKQS